MKRLKRLYLPELGDRSTMTTLICWVGGRCPPCETLVLACRLSQHFRLAALVGAVSTCSIFKDFIKP